MATMTTTTTTTTRRRSATPLLRIVFLATVLFAGRGAGAARTLRQYVGSMTGAEIDKSKYQVARTINAQAVSTTSAVVQANEIERAAIAKLRYYPGPMSKASTTVTSPTQSDQFQQEGAVDIPADAWGRAAVSDTVNGGAAIAASDAMVMAAPEGTAGTSRGATMPVMNPTMPTGTQASMNAISANYLPAGSFAQSEMGDGPNAVAHAGFAVATAMASKADPDDVAAVAGSVEAAMEMRSRKKIGGGSS